MDADWWARIQEVFERARSLPDGDRAAYLDEACGDDASRREVESLLEHARLAESLFPTPPEKGNVAVAATAETLDEDPGPGIKRPPGPMIANRYEVLGRLGKGGMGEVFRVRDHKIGKRLIALKRILHYDDQARQRFRREIDSAANLNHRNICRVHDRGEDEEGPFFTMELLNGGSLRDRIEKHGPLSDEDFVDLARQLAQALRYAHRKSIQHRDLKPSNVLFAEDGDPKLADFGLARVGPPSGLSITNQGLGTLGFSSPEQLRNSKAADHRADIYSLGATLYYALTGKAPVAVIEPSGIRHPWQKMILKCMKEDPSDRYFDAEEVLDFLENTPPTSGTGSTDKCSVCGAANAYGSSFCHQCGAGLNEPCPACNVQNRAGEEICRSCQINIPKRRASDKWLQEALAHVEKREYRRAARAASEALKLHPDRDEAKIVLSEAQDMQQQLDSSRDAAVKLESEKRYNEAEQAWKQLLEIDPENREALEAVERTQGKILDDRFVKKATQLRAAVHDRSLSRALRRLQELRAIAAPARGRILPQAEQAAEMLRRELILEQKDAFETALSCRDRKGARAAIGKFSELEVDEAEIAACLDRLASAKRWWRRRRILRRLVACFAVLMILATGYLLVAGWHNQKIADQAAISLADGPAADCEAPEGRFLPGWPWNPRAALRERCELCERLDGVYGSNQWRGNIERRLFGISSDRVELITEYNWFVLRQLSDAADNDEIEKARGYVWRIEGKELGSDGAFFASRKEDLEKILTAWYRGAPSFEDFANPGVIDPTSLFISDLETSVRNASTDCDTIGQIETMLTKLDRATAVAIPKAAHNRAVLEGVREAFDGRQLERVADFLDRLCIEGAPDHNGRVAILRAIAESLDPPPDVDDFLVLNVELTRACDGLARNLQDRAAENPGETSVILTLLHRIARHVPDRDKLQETMGQVVTAWTTDSFLALHEAFRTDGAAGRNPPSLLEDSGEIWPHLKDKETVASWRDRQERLIQVRELWSDGELDVSPLGQLERREGVDSLWEEFLGSTQMEATEKFYEEEDLERANSLGRLLANLGHSNEDLEDLLFRCDIRRTLDKCAEGLSTPRRGQLLERVIKHDSTNDRATEEVATEVMVAAIECEALDAALQLAHYPSRLSTLGDIATRLDERPSLANTALSTLHADLLSEPKLPKALGRVEGEIRNRLDRCFPSPATLEYPGKLRLGSGYDVDRVVIRLKDGSTLPLEPRGEEENVYDVPFVDAESVMLSLEAPEGVTADRVFSVVLHGLDGPAEVTFPAPYVVAGDCASLEIAGSSSLKDVKVDGEGLERGDLVEEGDHWKLELKALWLANDLASDRQCRLVLVTPEGIQRHELSITVVSKAFSEAEELLRDGQFREIFDKLGGMPASNHRAVGRLVEYARKGWFDRLERAAPTERRAANELMDECSGFLGVGFSEDWQQPVREIHDQAWTRRIDLTTTWETVDALKEDLEFLKALKSRSQLQQEMMAWLQGAEKWAQPIVDQMERQEGDWSTKRDVSSAGEYPALLVHRRTGLKFVFVPSGSFRIGGDSRNNYECPHREVTVTGFYLSKTEVTSAAWQAGSGKAPPRPAEQRLPKTMVSFQDAKQWCQRFGLDLPTEAQWEWAAGGSDSAEYPCGESTCKYFKRRKRDSALAAVASCECDRSAWCGAMDMAGNVREWCYPVATNTYDFLADRTTDPPGLAGGVITRGASYRDKKQEGHVHHRAVRYKHGAPADVGAGDHTIGFRPVFAKKPARRPAG